MIGKCAIFTIVVFAVAAAASDEGQKPPGSKQVQILECACCNENRIGRRTSTTRASGRGSERTATSSSFGSTAKTVSKVLVMFWRIITSRNTMNCKQSVFTASFYSITPSPGLSSTAIASSATFSPTAMEPSSASAPPSIAASSWP